MEATSKTVKVQGNSRVDFTCEEACELGGITVDGGTLVRAYVGSNAKPLDLFKRGKFTPHKWSKGERLTAIVCQKGDEVAEVRVALERA